MNVELFIAKHVLKNKSGTKRISKPITRLAIGGITLGIAVMLLSVSIAKGFQHEIRDKVVGFGSHIQISASYSNQSFESTPMLADQSFIPNLKKDPQVKHIQNFGYKPAIIQSRNKEENAINDVMGIVFKGIDSTFDATFFNSNLIEGKIPTFSAEETNDTIILSKYLVDKLQLKLNDKVSTFFVDPEGPKQRNLIVGAIYETGLEAFDMQFGLFDLNHIRKLSKWGIKTQLIIQENCTHNNILLEAKVIGGNGNYRYNWNETGYSTIDYIELCPIKDTLIQLVATDYELGSYLDDPLALSIPDTAWVKIKVNRTDGSCNCTQSGILEYYEDSIIADFGTIGLTIEQRNSGGSGKYYTGGIEVLLNNYDDLFEARDIISQYTSYVFNVSTITEKNPEIFNWLNMLDTNVYIIIGLMILVAIINMTSALLVIILEKTNFIGILKALGATNWSIRKVFIYNGAYLILKGLLYGNLLAILVILLQTQFHIITLPQENYYVSVVPMEVNPIYFLVINAGAFLISYIALILPSFMITKVDPVKAIRFD